jgi:hypothetical protein
MVFHRLVDVYGRFYLPLRGEMSMDFQAYSQWNDLRQFEFTVKVIRNSHRRSQVPGSLTDDTMNLEIVPGDDLMLHPEANMFKFDVETTNVSTIMQDSNCLSLKVLSFIPSRMGSGSTIAGGVVTVVGSRKLIAFMETNDRINNTRARAIYL